MPLPGGHKLPRVRKGRAAAVRIVDLVVAASSLILITPILLVISVAIVFESGRPVFFSQPRLGRLGRPFRIYKFRKFFNGCGKIGPRVTTKNDCRMTRLGRLLERTKMDELPQLWNVLRGDMSIVGPRPESLELAECFTVGYLNLLDHKPGIFGPNQVVFRNECALYPDNLDPERFYRDVLFPLKARIDLAYLQRRTMLSDMEWVIRGVSAVFGWRSLPSDILPDDNLPSGLGSTILAKVTASTVVRSYDGAQKDERH
jgi:lipopolysaccharide/colanic/teichoic acid biosynthesis glycosyltransferase